jgi:hypothetical protein
VCGGGGHSHCAFLYSVGFFLGSAIGMCSSACSISLCAGYGDMSVYLTLLECDFLSFPWSWSAVHILLAQSCTVGCVLDSLCGEWLCVTGATGVMPPCSVCSDVYCAAVC